MRLGFAAPQLIEATAYSRATRDNSLPSAARRTPCNIVTREGMLSRAAIVSA